MFKNLLKTNNNFIKVYYLISLEHDVEYKDSLSIINNKFQNIENQNHYSSLNELFSDDEFKKIQLFQQKMKPISKITSLNQKIRSMYCLF